MIVAPAARAALSVLCIVVAISATRVVADAHQCLSHMSTTTTAVEAPSHGTTVWCCRYSCRPTVDRCCERRVRYAGGEAATAEAVWAQSAQNMELLVESIQDRGYDFVIIDCPAGIDVGFINAIAPAQEAVVVTTPEITAIRDADRVAGLLEANSKAEVHSVELRALREELEEVGREHEARFEELEALLKAKAAESAERGAKLGELQTKHQTQSSSLIATRLKLAAAQQASLRGLRRRAGAAT